MTKRAEPAFWAVLPAPVRYSKTISPNAKLLYAEISSLADTKGYCWATNDYFSDLYDIKVRSVQRLIRQLAEEGFILVDVVRDDQSKEVMERRIYVGKLPDPPDIQCHEVMTKLSRGSRQNCHVEYINNNTIPPIIPREGDAVPKKKNSTGWMPERFEAFWRFFPRGESNANMRKAQARRAWNQLKPDDELIARMGAVLQKQKLSPMWQRGIGIPYASTWLNEIRRDGLPEPDEIPIEDDEPKGAYEL